MVRRINFTAHVRDQADVRAQGRCEICGGLLKPGQFEYDHLKSAGLGGDASLSNCYVLCRPCHLKKTMEEDMPLMRAADRKAKGKLPVAAGDGLTNLARRFRKGPK